MIVASNLDFAIKYLFIAKFHKTPPIYKFLSFSSFFLILCFF